MALINGLGRMLKKDVAEIKEVFGSLPGMECKAAEKMLRDRLGLDEFEIQEFARWRYESRAEKVWRVSHYTTVDEVVRIIHKERRVGILLNTLESKS